MFFTPYCLHRKPAAARRGRVCSPTRTSVTTAFAAPTMVAPKHHVKDEDGVPCYIYKMPKQMLVKVGSGSSADTFQLKSAEWADVKAGSHDAAVRAQARSRPKYEAIAAARASASSSAPELTDDAG